jgi:hypothetical protein
MHVDRVELIIVSAGLFRSVKCRGGILKQNLTIITVAREKADSDASGSEEFLAVQIKWRPQYLVD